MSLIYALAPRDERRIVFQVHSRKQGSSEVNLVVSAYDKETAISQANRFFELHPDHYVEVSQTTERVEAFDPDKYLTTPRPGRG